MNISTGSEVSSAARHASAAKEGRFYVFEGIDGAGKSTVARTATELIATETDRETVLTAEPSGSWIGDCVRRANKEDIDDFAETLLFVADRAQHTQEINRMVEQGKIVICDRYYISTLAYQGVILEDRIMDPVLWLRAVNAPIIRMPDKTFYFRIEPKEAMHRMDQRDEHSKFEKLEFLGKVSAIYQEMSESDPSAYIIDASRPLEEVVSAVMDCIRNDLRSDMG